MMEDEVHVYYEDIKEKSKLAQSAKHIVRRSPRPKLNNYSKKELKQLNGPVYQYNPSKPMTYAEFGALPKNCQAEYLQALVDKYGIGPAAICEMFGRSNKTGFGSQLFKRLGIKTPKKIAKKATARFLSEFCRQAEETQNTVGPAETKPDMALQNMALCFIGVYSPEAIIQRLNGLFPLGAPVKVRVEIEVC